MKKEEFFAKFKFNQERIGFVGIEREQFTIDPRTGIIVPRVPEYLTHLATLNGTIDHSRFQFGYELSACQLESKIGPCPLNKVWRWLHDCEQTLRPIDRVLGIGRMHTELAPVDMPLDIYPDPTGRYQRITEKMPLEILEAACRVAGTHIHIGMPDLETAIRVYDRVIAHTNELIQAGDCSSGERMRLYRVMAPRYQSEPIGSLDGFYQQAEKHGFLNDPRSWWTLVRISIHGTIEFRMFGAVDSIDKVSAWAMRCHELCF